MAGVDWLTILDLDLAMSNVRSEFPGDWHRDPWGWPELGFLVLKSPKTVAEHCAAAGSRGVAPIDVPKDNWGSRPAVVLDPLDRLMYQALIDRLSVHLIGNLTPNAFGWRLPAVKPSAGTYSHNNKQWDGYRSHLSTLAGLFTVALKTDISSFFASVPLEALSDDIDARAPKGVVPKRLIEFLGSLNGLGERSGLPQRSIASSVLANMVLIPLDDVLLHHATPVPRRLGSRVRYHSFARWMDDVWLFGHDAGKMRAAQVELQATANSLGLLLNSGKTELLEGDAVAQHAREVEHSAVDDAALMANLVPLEELIDKILDAPDTVGRTTIKFASTRMRAHSSTYRIQELLDTAARMPHGADAWFPLFKANFNPADLQDWFLDYVKSDWAVFEWAIAQYGRMFGSARKPRKATRELFVRTIENPAASLPALALAAQRVAEWDPAEYRAVARAAIRTAENPHARRVLALAALQAGEGRAMAKRWLSVHPDNALTLAMLEDRSFVPPKVVADYAA